ncbi:MAG: hypothetical protein JST89_11845 [Cyanobacteria bacterium SZAS-4]|nr:hypothetical protein [Cyanobacteria bacterium SZAS-4]
MFKSFWLFLGVRGRPSRAKERAEKLLRTAPRQSLLSVQATAKSILQELVSENLVLENAADHNERAHAYRLLGDLRVKQMNFADAEKHYQAAIDSYNDALNLEADNRTAISNKFKTVEAMEELKRTRF